MPRRIRMPLVLCALALPSSLAVTAASAGARPEAHSTATCGEARPGSLNGGYIYMVTTRGVGCGIARHVELAWQNCRLKGGRSGRCHARVVGYTCRERRQSDGTTLIGVVSCRRTSKQTIAYTYLQDL